jgi:hypothetical protein
VKLVGSIILLGVAWGGFHLVSEHRAASATREVLASSNVNGFLDIPPPSNQSADSIYVVAAQNCPREAAQRADGLAKQLGAKGLPVVRTSQVSFNPSGMDKAALERLKVVMGSPLPLVFIRGRAASNPDADQVAAEYRRVDATPST